MAATTPIQEPTDAELQAAWAAVRGPDWPTLPQILTAARQYQLVRGAALRLARGERAKAEPTANTPPRAAPRGPKPPHHPPQFDHKRAAAGDRDDD